MHEIQKVRLENGITLAYREYGTGDKYILSTQNFYFKDCYEAMLGQEPYDYHVFLIFMRGYGESDHIFDSEPRPYTRIWGEDLVLFAKAMGIESFYYTGVSHGNFAGWYLAFHHPELIRAFACCDGIAKFVKKPQGVIPHAGKEADWDHVAGDREALSRIAWNETWPTDDPRRLARRRQNREEHLEILMHRKKEEFLLRNTDMSCSDAETEEEFLEDISKIPFPVLFWEGALDPLATVEEALKLCHRIPGAILLTYQQLGHGGADECPELAARDCDRFFHDVKGRIL